MGYELTIELEGGKLEIEADDWKELEKMVQAVDLQRLESLLGQMEAAEGGGRWGSHQASEVEPARRF